MDLVLLFDQRLQNKTFIDEHIIPPAMGFSQHPERRLVDTVDNPIPRDACLGTHKPRESREQVGHMGDVFDA